ncbi:MAG: DUF2312 domain-containing protein [Neomegalonema sp.]|nr:DUF2312 domain-containing protein [Neomegalonema sp.]
MDDAAFANPAGFDATTDTAEAMGSDSSHAFSKGQLKSVIERVERLEEEKKEVMEQIKEVYAEAKSNGFDVKILRKIVALRKKSPGERSEEEAVLETYLMALDMA